MCVSVYVCVRERGRERGSDLCFSRIILAATWKLNHSGTKWRQGAYLGGYYNNLDTRLL